MALVVISAQSSRLMVRIGLLCRVRILIKLTSAHGVLLKCFRTKLGQLTHDELLLSLIRQSIDPIGRDEHPRANGGDLLVQLTTINGHSHVDDVSLGGHLEFDVAVNDL